MKKLEKMVGSTLMIIILTLGSKFLSFFREVLIASKFGSGILTDTFFVAITATFLISGFITAGISTTFIPIVSEAELDGGKKGKIELTNNMINITFMISILLVVLEFIAAPIIIKLLAGGFIEEQLHLAIKLTRIGLPMIVFSGIIGILIGYLQSEERFTSTSLVGFPFNIIYIIYLIFFSNQFGIEGLMIASVIAVFSQLLILIPETLKAGFKHSFKFDIKDVYLRKIMLLILPVFVGVAINDLNTIIDRTLASNLAIGSISALNYASKLNGLLLGVFITAITTVIFPQLSKAVNANNIPGMKKIMNYGINLILIITVPATIGMIVLSTPIVEVAFERGEFDPNATLMTSRALIFYAVGLIGFSLQLLLARVYYSLQDTKTPMVNAIISVAINIVFNIIFLQFMDHSGLALATSLATTIATLLLLYGLKKKIGKLGARGYVTTLLKTGLASVIMGVVVYFIYNGVYRFLGVSKIYNAISLLLSAGVGGVLYAALCYTFKVKEIRGLVDKVILIFKKVV